MMSEQTYIQTPKWPIRLCVGSYTSINKQISQNPDPPPLDCRQYKSIQSLLTFSFENIGLIAIRGKLYILYELYCLRILPFQSWYSTRAKWQMFVYHSYFSKIKVTTGNFKRRLQTYLFNKPKSSVVLFLETSETRGNGGLSLLKTITN